MLLQYFFHKIVRSLTLHKLGSEINNFLMEINKHAASPLHFLLFYLFSFSTGNFSIRVKFSGVTADKEVLGDIELSFPLFLCVFFSPLGIGWVHWQRSGRDVRIKAVALGKGNRKRGK